MRTFFTGTLLILVLLGSSQVFCDQYQSRGTGGKWSDPSAWKKSGDGGKTFNAATSMPGIKPSDTVLINDGATFLLDTSVTVRVLTVGDGASGQLFFDSSGCPRKLVVLGTLTVRKGAELSTTRHGARATHRLELSGDLICDGKMNLTTNPQSGYCNTVFNGHKNDQTISGSGKDLVFRNVSVEKDTTMRKVIAQRDIMVMGGTISFQKGTWEQKSGLLTNNANELIQANGALIISGSASFYKLSFGLTVRGRFIVETTGKVKIGTFTGRGAVHVTQGAVEFRAGEVMIGGQLILEGGVTTLSGAHVSIDPQSGNKPLPGTLNVFEISKTANLTFTAGELTIVNPLAEKGTGREILINGSGNINMSGATISLGDGISSKEGGDGFEIEDDSYVPLYNVTVNTGKASGRAISLFSNLKIDGTLRYASGSTINKGSNTLTVHSTSDDR